MMEDVLIKEHIMAHDQRDEIYQMAAFVTIFYRKYFLQARLPTAAPRLDLSFLKYKYMCYLEVNYSMF